MNGRVSRRIVGVALGAFLGAHQVGGSELQFSTYFGGSNTDQGRAVAIDHLGNIILVGRTGSKDFPTTAPIQERLRSAGAAFVTKLDPTGTAVLFSTYLGGNGGTVATDVAVDGVGNIYVVGHTSATDFPTVNAFQAELQEHLDPFDRGADVFLAKLDPEGKEILFSSYLGGSLLEFAQAVVVDPSSGVAYVAGWTQSKDFPLVDPVQSRAAARSGMVPQDLFVAAIDTVSGELTFSTYWGGKNTESLVGLVLDPEKETLWLAGTTYSKGFPQVNPLRSLDGTTRPLGFLLKIDVAAAEVETSSPLPGIFSVLEQPRGGVFLLGSAGGSAANLFPDVAQACTGAVMFRVNRRASRLKFECLDGRVPLGIMARDARRRIVLALSAGPGRSTKNPVQREFAGKRDFFVARLRKSRTGVNFSTYLGGGGFDDVQDVAVSPLEDLIVVVGETRSNDFPLVRAIQRQRLGPAKKWSMAVAGIRP